ncbi:hypothetical protein ACKRLN_01690 [Anaerococcus sp. DFU013_CI05]|uniref:hypothetical protein n=1 Tax=unclassified Anaerococcus TaxID=2614126 RepID=UPI001932929E|nr:hypothetical protein [Anaerococcus sp. mt242]MBM0046664.1 hypothetical protein [Anaerococcus sp. mt242]
MKKILLTLALSLTLTSCGGNSIKPEKNDIKNGSGTETIGTMTVTREDEAKVTDEYIREWYEIVKDQSSDYDVIIYNESNTNNEGKGIYYDGSTIWKDVEFELGPDLIFTTSSMENAEEVPIQ